MLRILTYYLAHITPQSTWTIIMWNQFKWVIRRYSILHYVLRTLSAAVEQSPTHRHSLFVTLCGDGGSAHPFCHFAHYLAHCVWGSGLIVPNQNSPIYVALCIVWCCAIWRYSLREHTSNHFSKCHSLSFLLWKTLSSSSAQPESPRVRSLWKLLCTIAQPWFNFHKGADYRRRGNYRTTIIKPGWLSRCQELNYSNYLHVQRLLWWEAGYWNYWEKISSENLCYVSVP